MGFSWNGCRLPDCSVAAQYAPDIFIPNHSDEIVQDSHLFPFYLPFRAGRRMAAPIMVCDIRLFTFWIVVRLTWKVKGGFSFSDRADLETFNADRFNFDHCLRLRPCQSQISAATVSDHINSHRQTWSTWKHWIQRVLESKSSGTETAINHYKLCKNSLLTSLSTASQILSWGFAISHFFLENAFIPRSIMVYCICEVMA